MSVKQKEDIHALRKVGQTLSAGDQRFNIALDFIDGTEIWHLKSVAIVLTTLTRGVWVAGQLLTQGGGGKCTPVEGPLWRAGRGINWTGNIPVTRDDNLSVYVANATASDVLEYYFLFERAYK